MTNRDKFRELHIYYAKKKVISDYNGRNKCEKILK